MPWYAVAFMLAGPCAIGIARIVLTIARLAGWQRDPRPGYVDIQKRT